MSSTYTKFPRLLTVAECQFLFFLSPTAASNSVPGPEESVAGQAIGNVITEPAMSSLLYAQPTTILTFVRSDLSAEREHSNDFQTSLTGTMLADYGITKYWCSCSLYIWSQCLLLIIFPFCFPFASNCKIFWQDWSGHFRDLEKFRMYFFAIRNLQNNMRSSRRRCQTQLVARY